MDPYTAPDTALVSALAPATDITTATATVMALDSEPTADLVLTPVMNPAMAPAPALASSPALALQSDDEVSHFLHRSEESPEEF
jgi:hypothetical protein